MQIKNLALAAVLLLASGMGRAADAPTALDLTDQNAPAFHVFTAKDGLSDEIWSTVGVDGAGFVWAGSASKLARFDGYRWSQIAFPEAESLVRDMVTDQDGTLWAIFEREGLARYDGHRWALTGNRSFAQRFSTTIAADGLPTQWVAQGQGVARLQHGAWFPDPGNSELPTGNTIRIERTETLFGGPREWLLHNPGQLWFRTIDRADSRGAWQRFEMAGLHMSLGTDLLRSSDRGVEELWILTYGSGVYRLRADGLRRWRAASGELPSEAVYSAVATHSKAGERSLWLATRGGLVRIRGEQTRTFDRRHGLPSNAVRGIKLQRSLDGTDLLWLATEGGVARAALTASQWQTVSLIGAAENGVFGVLLEPDGEGGERLWVGSAKEGVGLLERGRWRYFTQENGELPAQTVRAIWRLDGPDGKPWRLVGMVGGALLRISEDLTFAPLAVPWSPTSGEAATSALSRRTRSGIELWFGTFEAGVFRFANGRWSSFAETAGAHPWAVLGLAEQVDRAGRSTIWAAGSQGLARFDGERFQLLPTALGLPEDGYRSVTVIAQDGRRELWAGSNRHGLVRLDVSDPAAPRLLADEGVPAAPDPTVYSVKRDSRGRIYVCTNNGVQQLTPTPGGGYAERVFRRRDGLVHDECNSNSQWIDQRDRYWAGTLGGLSVYDPQAETPGTGRIPKPLYFTAAQVDGESLPLADDGSLSLSAGSHDLRIDFSLLTGSNEEQSRYRSQLIGHDPAPGPWSAERSRAFGNLPPGAYRLVVEARDFAGTASQPRELRLSIAPYWWQRPLLQSGLILLALALALLLVQLYNRQLRQRQRALTRLVDERTALLNQANARLTELSYLDPLTGIANRRRLMEAIEAALDRARAQSLPLGLIVIDVDHFKEYNDRNGHLAGDAALRAVARALESATREQDLVARFGGEEFACLLLDADQATVARIAERMRALVEALPPRALGGDSQTITVSAGILSCVPGPEASAVALLARADGALYQAKHAGRNCVITAPAGPESE